MMPKFEYVIKPLEVKKNKTKNPNSDKNPLKTKQPPQKLSQKPA